MAYKDVFYDVFSGSADNSGDFGFPWPKGEKLEKLLCDFSGDWKPVGESWWQVAGVGVQGWGNSVCGYIKNPEKPREHWVSMFKKVAYD